MFYRWLIGIFILLTPLLSAREPQEYVVIPSQAKIPVLTPSLSKRETLKIRLKNRLEAYIISDPLAQKSGAALSVKVGSWEDPKEYPGIAHFTEHLLFLGTKKYPEESEYSKYISENGGMSNAFTFNHSTSFLFTIDNAAFDKALDRFSQFFIAPLFNPSGVDRELKAIDQEYAKNIENEDFRQLFVHKQLSNPEHPNHAFSMGNSQSLKKISREVLIDWYKTHYSANLMKLLVYSPQPLDKLVNLVVEDFSEIPNNDKPLFSTTMPSYSEENRGKMVYIEPLKKLRTLDIIWEMPSKFAEFLDAKPHDLVCFVLGHEGKESLLAQLKREKLAEELRCGGIKTGEKLFEFYIEIDLTQKGLNEINTVMLRCFQAIANLKTKGIPESLFDDLKKIEMIDYQYQVREDEFSELMKNIRLIIAEPLESFPEKSQIITSYDPKLVQEFLDGLTPENCEIQVIASPAESGVKPDQTERWLGTSYAIKPIPEEILKEWKEAQPHPAIDLPEPNPFIPRSLALKSPKEGNENGGYLPEPTKVLDDENGLVYFVQDNRYKEPKIYWSFEFRTPQVLANEPSKVVMADLFIKNVTEVLNQLSYTAKLGGLNYDISLAPNGIAVSLDGYNENASILFEKIIEALTHEQMTKENFALYKDKLLRKYLNFNLEMPIVQALDYFRQIVYKQYTSEKQKAFSIRKINFDQYNAYQNQIFKNVYFQGMLYGNMTAEEAQNSVKLVKKYFTGSPYPKAERPEVEVIVLNPELGPTYVECVTKSLGNAVVLAIESEPYSFKNRASQQIVLQAMKEPFFSTLRTKQQTGYLVFSSGEELRKHMFNMFSVQSNTHSPKDLLARFELFIESFLQEIKLSELREEQFLAIKAAVLATMQEPPKNLVEMGKMLKLIAFDYDADFKWMDKRIQALKDLTYDECIDYAKASLGKKNGRRLGILLKGGNTGEELLDFKKARSIAELKKNSLYTTGV